MKTVHGEVQREFIQLWARMSKFWGVSSGTARVYAWLLARPDGGDTDTIMAGLRLGRGTVSMACRELREWGLILSEPAAGSRRTRHQAETDLSKVVRSIIEHRKRREWDPILERLRDWIPRLAGEDAPETDAFRQRLEAMEACLESADTLAMRFLAGATLPPFSLPAVTAGETPGSGD